MLVVEFSWIQLEVKWDLSFETWKMKNFIEMNGHKHISEKTNLLIIDPTQRAAMENQ